MLYIERNQEGAIVAIRRGEFSKDKEPVSFLDDEIHMFLKESGDLDSISQFLNFSDNTLVRVLEDLIDLLIAKNLILFTDLPVEAQEKIHERKLLRSKIGDDQLMVDDIL